jgi:hypothetical protein
MPHFGARKTKAMRDAIDERARNWERPPSPAQRSAIADMARAPLAFAWAYDTWGGHKATTIDALTRRGLCRIEGKQRMRACITRKGSTIARTLRARS